MTYASTSEWLSDELLADPFPHYRALRQIDPVLWDEFRSSWMLLRYHDVARVLKDDTTFSAEQFGGTPNSMLVSDPPRHTRLRTLVSKAFTPARVRELRPRIQAIVDDLLDAAADQPTFDAISEFAYPLPITVIAELLGVDAADRDLFRDASQKIALSLGPSADPHTAARADEGRVMLRRYFDGLIERRTAAPQDDLVSALIQAEERGDLLGHGELLAMLTLLLIGGHETTVNLIGNGLNALFANPDQLARLRTTNGNERRAVDELLRYDPPVLYTGRIARRHVEVGGTAIKPGERVRAMLAAANRDPEVYPDPDRLDLTRDHGLHLAFGLGVHFCLGAELARVEGEIAIPGIIRRFPRLRPVGGPPRWRPASVLRGLEALPLAH